MSEDPEQVCRDEYKVKGVFPPAVADELERELNEVEGVLSTEVTSDPKRAEITHPESASERVHSGVHAAALRVGVELEKVIPARKLLGLEWAELFNSAEFIRFLIALTFFGPGLWLHFGADGGGSLGFGLSLADTMLLVSFFVGGWRLLLRGVQNLAKGSFTFETLMSTAFLGALGLGVFVEAAISVMLYSVAENIEGYVAGRSKRSLQALLSEVPETARVIDLDSGEQEEKQLEDVEVDEHVLVRPGEGVPLDGVVVRGESTVDESSLTGESRPVAKEIGNRVWSGTVNQLGVLVLRVTKEYEESTIARLVELMEQSLRDKPAIASAIDRFAAWYTPAMIVLAALTAAVPPLWGAATGSASLAGLSFASFRPSIHMALVLLLISCPGALVIATPITVSAGVINSSRKGVLVKGGRFLEELQRMEVIYFDKTGTLTKNRLSIGDRRAWADAGEVEELEHSALSLANLSDHPATRALLRYSNLKNASPVDDFNYEPGKGIHGEVNNRRYYLGSLELLREHGLELTEGQLGWVKDHHEKGNSVVLLGNSERLLIGYAMQDELREGVAQTVRELRAVGVDRIELLSGDSEDVTREVASRIGADAFHAPLKPEEKVDFVKRMAAERGRVAMVGDGINDAAALAQANVGVAMGELGSETVLESADIVLMRNNLEDLPYLFRLGSAVSGRIRGNIVLAFALKAVLIGAVYVYQQFLTTAPPLWLGVLGDTGAEIIVSIYGFGVVGFGGD